MKLELGFIHINNIQISKECKVENGTLYVDPEAVKAFMYEDDDVKAWVKDFSFDVAKPGESVRITPVKDVIEPRVKVEGPGGEFPGVIAKVDGVSVAAGNDKLMAQLGIEDPRLRAGDMLAAVGVYKGPGIKPVYKHLRRGEAVGLSLDVTFQGVPISIHIGDKEIAIEVREKVYSINYFVCIGQMVVLDHRTKRVKFWEEKGYSARKEGIGSLRRGDITGAAFNHGKARCMAAASSPRARIRRSAWWATTSGISSRASCSRPICIRCSTARYPAFPM